MSGDLGPALRRVADGDSSTEACDDLLEAIDDVLSGRAVWRRAAEKAAELWPEPPPDP